MTFMIAWLIKLGKKEELHFILLLENFPCSIKAIKVSEQTHLVVVVKVESIDLYNRLVPFVELQIIKGLKLDQCKMMIEVCNLFDEILEKNWFHGRPSLPSWWILRII